MADVMNENEKTLEVEPAAEGPKVKAKRVLTEAQLEALKRGRSKLAEKRKLAAVAAVEEPTAEVKKEVGPEEPEIGWASASIPSEEVSKPKEETTEETIEEPYQWCSVM